VAAKARASEHWGLKLVSLLLGFSFWFAVAREQGAELAISTALQLRDLPEGLEVIEESVQQVEVRLRGPAETLRSLTPQRISAGVDLSDAGPGERIVYLTPENVTAPFGIRVMRVTPSSLALSLDRTTERSVELIPRVLGAPADGFELRSIELNPKKLQVVGPATRLRGIDQVTTEPVSAEGLREPYSRAVRLELDPLVRLDRDTTVTITLDVREERVRREIRGVPLPEPIAGAGRYSSGTVDVVVEGPRSVVETLDAAELEVLLPLGALGSGRHRVVPIVRVRNQDDFSEIRFLEVVPGEIEVEIP
jgi:YbbR domain-containing protein